MQSRKLVTRRALVDLEAWVDTENLAGHRLVAPRTVLVSLLALLLGFQVFVRFLARTDVKASHLILL